MTIIIPDNQIAAGNNNAGGLTLVTSIQDSDSVNFMQVQSLPFRKRGERRYNLDGTVSFIGTESVEWLSSAMTVAQYDYILDTYEGLVTIRHPNRTVTSGVYVFANYNAVLTMPDEVDMEFVRNLRRYNLATNFSGPGYLNVVWSFKKVEAI